MVKIVILGGGFGGVYAAKSLLSKLRGTVHRIVMVGRTETFTFNPLLHEVSAGFLQESSITQNITQILKCPNFEFIKAEISKISFEDKKVETTSGSLNYDYLLVALGSAPNLGLIWKLNASPDDVYTLKTTMDAAKIKEKLNDLAVKFENSQSESKKLNIVFIGTGPAAIETVGEINNFYMQKFKCTDNKDFCNKVSFTMLDKADKILPSVSDSFRNEVIKKLDSKKIRILSGVDIKKIENGKIEYAHEGKTKSMTASMIFLTAGVSPSPVETDKKYKNEKGFFKVNKHLEIENAKDAWAIGDNAFYLNPADNLPVPMLAQSAKDEGIFVAGNIANGLSGKSQLPYAFHSKGFLLSVGQGFAVGDVFGKIMKGWMLWWMKRTVYTTVFIGRANKIKKFWLISVKACFKRR